VEVDELMPVKSLEKGLVHGEPTYRLAIHVITEGY
jgi:hypothetical protein